MLPGMEIYVGPESSTTPDWADVGELFRMWLAGGVEGEIIPEECYSTRGGALEAEKRMYNGGKKPQ